MSLKNSLQVLTPLALILLIASSSAAFADPTYGVSRKEEIHSVLYKIYKQQQKLDLMGKEVAAITAINPNNVTIQQDWAHTLTVATHYKEAVPHWLIVTKAQPTSADSWAALGDCYMQLANYAAALNVYTKAVQTQRPGQDFRARYQLAQTYIEHAKQERNFKDQQKKKNDDSDE